MSTLQIDRDNYIDAIRGAAIYLVVLGHLIEPMVGYAPATYIYIGIYLFHMPLFVFLSGIFAKRSLGEREASLIIRRLFLPLLIFQILYNVFVYIFPSGYEYGPLMPHSILWFLLSLIFWRILYPLFCSPTGLIISIIAAAAAGYYPFIGYELSLGRTVYFFPFFIFGGLFGQRIIQTVRYNRFLFGMAFVASVAIGLYWAQNGLHQHALYGGSPYRGTAVVFTDFPTLGRLSVMLLSSVAVIGFCSLIPVRSQTLARLGVSTLAIYLLHQFFALYLSVKSGSIIVDPSWRLATFIFGAFALSFTLSYAKPAIDRSMDLLASLFHRINKALC